MTEAVIFDLGGVIVPFDMKRGYAALAPLCNFPAVEIPRRLAATDLVVRFETGGIEPREFVSALCTQLGLAVGYEEFCRLWSAIFLPDILIPESVFAAIGARHRLLLLSNTNALHFEMIAANYPVVRHFHEFVLSHEVGALKPAPEMYREAIRRAGCPPDRCLFIDDLAPNVEAARREGIDAVQFTGWEALQPMLAARGIAWR